jgi:HAD superfamily hydrolase (TIGR01509 family)
MKYKCIIFDCDGVLVDSEPIANQLLITMAAELGVAIDMNFAIDHFIGKSLYTCMETISQYGKIKLPDNFEKDFRTRSFQKFKEQLQPIPGIKDVLKRLELPFCVASSGPINKIELNLKTTGLYSFFEGKIFSCYMVNTWKPEPDVFLLAAKTMGFAPKDCLVVEDSLAGITAAQNGGFDVVAYKSEFNIKELQNLEIPKISNMKELFKFIS